MIFKSSQNKNINEIQQNAIKKIQNSEFNISDENGNYTFETYKKMINDLPNMLSMLEQEINAQQMDEELNFFQLLIKFPRKPDEIADERFMLSVLDKIQQFNSQELLFKFSVFIIDFYDCDIYVPPDELIQFAIQFISDTTLPFQLLHENIFSNLLVFLSTSIDYLDESLINDLEFYKCMTNFFDISTNLNLIITYLFSVLIDDCSNDEVLSYFPSLMELMYDSIIPSTMKSIQEGGDEESLKVLMNITSTIFGFATRNMELNKKYFQLNAESIIIPISDFWDISNSVNANLIDIVRIVAKEAISLFDKSESTETLQNLLEVIQACLEKGGEQTIMSSIMASTDYSVESLSILKTLIGINLKQGTSFLFEGENDLCPIFRRILYFCADGKLKERFAAGCCLSIIIRKCPNFMLTYLLEDKEMLSYFQENSDEIDEISDVSDLNFISIIDALLALDNNHLSKQLIKALLNISRRFDDMDKVHEFREKCAQFYIQEKINAIIDKYHVDDKELANLGEIFVAEAFGPVSYNDYDDYDYDEGH